MTNKPAPSETAAKLASSAVPAISLLGCGWLGVALAPSLQQNGLHVRGSTTQTAKLSLLNSLDIEAHLLRIEPSGENETHSSTATNDRFFQSETLIINIPPETAMGPDFHPSQLQEILQRLNSNPGFKHLLYVSSTSVYGSNQGEVNESTLPEPDPGSGEILLHCEALLTKAAREQGFALTIVRSAGLMGPGRHPGLFLSGRKNVRNASGPVNMIHQADLVQVITALVTSHPPKENELRIFNAVAAAHPTRLEFYTTASQSVGVEPPTFSESPDTDDKTSKLVHGSKAQVGLGLKFRYDDLYSGFGAKKP